MRIPHQTGILLFHIQVLLFCIDESVSGMQKERESLRQDQLVCQSSETKHKNCFIFKSFGLFYCQFHSFISFFCC